MIKLTSSQRSYLRAQAHHLEPMVYIGKNGVNDGALKNMDQALESRELIKIKFRDFKDEKISLTEHISTLLHCHVLGIIGHAVILFRQNPDPEKQKIHIPIRK